MGSQHPCVCEVQLFLTVPKSTRLLTVPCSVRQGTVPLTSSRRVFSMLPICPAVKFSVTSNSEQGSMMPLSCDKEKSSTRSSSPLSCHAMGSRASFFRTRVLLSVLQRQEGTWHQLLDGHTSLATECNLEQLHPCPRNQSQTFSLCHKSWSACGMTDLCRSTLSKDSSWGMTSSFTSTPWQHRLKTTGFGFFSMQQMSLSSRKPAEVGYAQSVSSWTGPHRKKQKEH